MANSYLQLPSKLVNVATFFIVVVGVAPEETGLLGHGVPALEFADATDALAVIAVDELVELSEREGLRDDSVIVLQGSRGKVDERLEVMVPEVVVSLAW